MTDDGTVKFLKQEGSNGQKGFGDKLQIVIPTSNKEDFRFLTQYVPPLEAAFLGLSKEYKFKLPVHVIFRNMRQPNPNTIRCAWANAGYNSATGFYVGLDIKSLKRVSHMRRLNDNLDKIFKLHNLSKLELSGFDLIVL